MPGFSHLWPLAGMRAPMVAAVAVCALALWFGLRLAHLSDGPKPQHAE